MFENAINSVVNDLIQDIGIELTAQGHRLTGKAIDSLRSEIESTGDGIKAIIYMEDYGKILDTGVSAARIPFNPGNGSGSSQYINGLINFVKLRAMGDGSDKSNRSIAFAIARKHKIEGMPTANSYTFSSNGRRTNFIQAVMDKNENKINREVTQAAFEEIDKAETKIKRA